MNTIKCEICGKELKSSGMGVHIKSHNISAQEYYDKFLKKDKSEGICPICGKPTKFYKLTKGYSKYCSTRCSTIDTAPSSKSLELRCDGLLDLIDIEAFKEYYTTHSMKDTIKVFNLTRGQFKYILQTCNIPKHTQEESSNLTVMNRKTTYLEKYGVENATQAESVKEKIRKTCLERYGVQYSLQAKEVREKIEQTCLEKYGVPTVCQADEIIQKIKENNIKKYGVSCTLCTEENIEKKKKTWKEKYGVDWVTQAEEVKEVNRQTCLEKYGVEYYLQTSEKKEKSRQTCLERYGVEHPSQAIEVKEKISQTCLERYGVEYYWQSDELKTILQENKDEIVKKIHDTKKKNGTFGKSAIEDKIFEQLKLIYKKVERQYREERYPFNCDFYIPEYDLFIELNGFCTHNNHWYDESSENDRKIVEDLKTKNTDFCNAIIDTWTKSDVIKRNTAKQNNLNYVVFWDENDFNNWVEEGRPIRKDWK